ncbi:hypothetical protein EDD11_009146 [Mortierella claussenii]|nr:hypothetical protein EDD11_009146 [Mortierella claussenii]
MVRFRRATDGVIFNALYYFFFLIAVGVLIYYGKTRISDVLGRDSVVQSTNKYASAGDPFMSIPDLVVCTLNLTYDPLTIPWRWTVTSVSLKEADLPPNKIVDSPCIRNATDMYIFSSIVNPAGTYGWGTPKFNFTNYGESAMGNFASVYIIPSQTNPYMNTTYIDKDKQPEIRDPVQRNSHILIQGYTRVFLSSTLERTEMLRNDFWGLFGVYNKTGSLYTITSKAETLMMPNTTVFVYNLPTVEVRSHQVLLLSAPEAFSSWGGAVSIILSIFYLLFGHKQKTPIGIIQKALLGKGTKARMTEIYNSSRPNGGSSSSSSNRSNRSINYDKVDTHPSTSLHHASAPQQLQQTPLAPLPYLLPYNNNNNNTQTDFHLQQDSNQTSLLQQHQQQHLIHHQELISLREQVASLTRVLAHFQRHSQQNKNLEALLKEYYLDMDLVETDGKTTTPEGDVDLKEALFTPAKSDSLLSDQELRKRKNWDLKDDDTQRLREAEYGAGSYGNNTQCSHELRPI